MGWLEGVLTGYADRHYEIQKQKRADAELAANREGKVFETLLSSPYKDIQNYALAGMLDLGNPRRRKGGVAGWMGDVEQTPYLDMIQRARDRIGTDPDYAHAQLGDDEDGAAPATPSIKSPSGSVAAPPPGQPSAAQVSTSLVTGGPATAPTPAPPPPKPDVSFKPGAASGQAFGRPNVSFGPPPPGATAGPGLAGLPPGTDDMVYRGPFPPPPPEPIPNYDPSRPSPMVPLPYQTPPPASGIGQPPPVSFAPPTPPGQAAPGAAAQAAPAGPPLAIPTGPPPTLQATGTGLPGGTTRSVGPQGQARPARTQLPSIVPTAADLARQREKADVLGQVEGWQYLYKQMGDPDWQKKGVEAVLSAKRSALGGRLVEGNLKELPDGTWVQDLYDPYTGKLVNTIPHQGPLAGGTVGTTDSLAFEMYGKQGENPRETMRRISPFQMAQVNEELRHRKALQAAEVSLARAEAMADAPLTAQAKSQLIEVLNTKWLRLQQPLREMSRQFTTMQIGLKRFKEGDRIGGAQDILVTFQKILDPISVVRESEYARSAVGLSLMGRLEGYWDQLKKGGAGIPPEDLEKMVETSRQLLEGMQGWNDNERGRIEDRVNAHGIDPGFIFGGGVKKPPVAATPDASVPTDPTAKPKVGGPKGWTVNADGKLVNPDGVVIEDK